MPTKYDYRRENLRKLLDTVGGPGVLAKQLNYSNSSFLVQMVGPNPIRQVTETTARRFEQQLGLIPGSLDTPVDIAPSSLIDPATLKVRQSNLYRRAKGLEVVVDVAPAQMAQLAPQHGADVMTRAQLVSLVTLAGEVCVEQKVAIPTSKFADIIALAILAHDDQKPGGDKEYIKLLVSLTK